jgi:hypothetical protein
MGNHDVTITKAALELTISIGICRCFNTLAEDFGLYLTYALPHNPVNLGMVCTLSSAGWGPSTGPAATINDAVFGVRAILNFFGGNRPERAQNRRKVTANAIFSCRHSGRIGLDHEKKS